MRTNRDGTIPILMSTYKLDNETATGLYDSFVKGFNEDGSLPEDGLRGLIDDTKSITKVNREVAFSEVSDLSILRGNWESNKAGTRARGKNAGENQSERTSLV